MLIRDIQPNEHDALGHLMVKVYSGLDGFPSPTEQPAYYETLRGIGSFASLPHCRVLVAVTARAEVLGGVVYFGDMRWYGSGGTATSELNASGIRLLGVDPNAQGRGIGRKLSSRCIELARAKRHRCVVLHTTQPMRVAWTLYEDLGFARAADLDFTQGALPVYGFRLALSHVG